MFNYEALIWLMLTVMYIIVGIWYVKDMIWEFRFWKNMFKLKKMLDEYFMDENV